MGRPRKPEPKPERELTTFNVHDYPEILELLTLQYGIEGNRALGVVMLPIDGFAVASRLPGGKDDLYFSQDPNLWHVQGAVAERAAHVTLRFGLLQKAWDTKEIIDRILLEDGVLPRYGEFDTVHAFPSPKPETEPYVCIALGVKVDPDLLDAHNALGMLPNISTYSTYKPHVTIAYVKAEAADKWVEGWQHWLSLEGANRFSYTGGIDYGSRR